MTFITLIDQLNPKTFDIIMDEYLFNNSLSTDKNRPVKIEIYFNNIIDGKADNAYPKFEHRLTKFNDDLLSKAEIAGHLYLHYKNFDIDDDCIDYVIVSITIF